MNLAEALPGPAKLERFGEGDAVVSEDRRLGYRALAALADRRGKALLRAAPIPAEGIALLEGDAHAAMRRPPVLRVSFPLPENPKETGP